MSNRILWSVLELYDYTQGSGGRYLWADSGPGTVELVLEYLHNGTINGWCFNSVGEDHEDAEDMCSWGPRDVTRVDWTGFIKAVRKHLGLYEARKASARIKQVKILSRASRSIRRLPTELRATAEHLYEQSLEDTRLLGVLSDWLTDHAAAV